MADPLDPDRTDVDQRPMTEYTGRRLIEAVQGLSLGGGGGGGATPVGAPNYANGQVTASTMATTLVGARFTRRSVTLVNMDAAITVFIGAATVSAANGVPLKPSQSISIDTVGLIQVIAASGSPVVAFIETFD